VTRVFLINSWRKRWRALVVLAVMIGLTGAIVFAAIAGARRSASALDRFHDAGRTLDVLIAADVLTPEPPALLELLDGPLVESTNDLAFLFVDVDSVGVIFAPTSRRGTDIEQGVLLKGRRANPDEPDEVALAESTAKNQGLGVGDVFEAGSLSQEQADLLFSTGEEPTSLDGPLLQLRVVGIVRTGFDLNGFGKGTAATLTTPAFWEKYGGQIGIGSRSHMLRLVDAPGALDQFLAGVNAAYSGEHLPSINVGQGEGTVADSISVVTAALVAMSLVIGGAGLLWVAAATSRHQRLASSDIDVLRMLGTTTRERRILFLGCVAPALVAGLVLAPLLAVAMSPLFPVGVARFVDPDPGLHADMLTLLAGTGALAVVLAVVATIAAARSVARGHASAQGLRVPRLVDRAARTLRPAPGTGVRFALSAPGRSTAPVRPALVGALVGVVGLVAVAVIGASLQRLVDTPARWGTTWDVAVNGAGFAIEETAQFGDGVVQVDHRLLLDDPGIESATVALYDEQLKVDGAEAISMTFEPVKGDIGPTVIEGRAPISDDEIALGRDTLHEAGAAVGDTVAVTSRSQVTEQFRVVGVIVFPTIGEPTALATGATLTRGGGDRLLLGTGSDDVGTPYVLLRWTAGTTNDEALDSRGITARAAAFDNGIVPPTQAPEVEGLVDVQQFPLMAGAALAVLGLIATTHALIVTVRRRRLELGVLSALGFAPAQRRAVIVGQATTIAVIALAVGVPAGVLVGRVVWSAMASSMGVATDASFPLAVLAGGAIAFVLALNVIAAFPARSASRLRVAAALRSE
jgi:FtsX-like permease family